MKKIWIVVAALGSVACVEVASKGSNPDITADTSQSGNLFVEPQQPAPETNPGTGGTSLGDPNRVISELSPTELTGLCDATLATVNAALGGKTLGQVGCQVAYFSFSFSDEEAGDITTVCEDIVATCADSDDTFECPFADQDVSDCDATVGEFQACLNAISSVYGEIANLSCSTLTMDDLRGLENFEEPSECREFERKCNIDNGGEEPQPVDPPRPEPDPQPSNSGNNFPDDGGF